MGIVRGWDFIGLEMTAGKNCQYTVPMSGKIDIMILLTCTPQALGEFWLSLGHFIILH